MNQTSVYEASGRWSPLPLCFSLHITLHSSGQVVAQSNIGNKTNICSSRWMQMQDGKVQACFLLISWLSRFLSYFLRPPLCLIPSLQPSAERHRGIFFPPPITTVDVPVKVRSHVATLVHVPLLLPWTHKNHMHMDARRRSCPFEHVPAADLSPAGGPNNPLSVRRAAEVHVRGASRLERPPRSCQLLLCAEVSCLLGS